MFQVVVKNDFGQIIERMFVDSAEESEMTIRFLRSAFPNATVKLELA